jgi:glucosamine--fructose-6-phosphate aminotransferase (isomerizing)
MCCLFGFYDLNASLPPKVKNKLLRELSIAAEARGKDATGIAYVADHELKSFKIGKPAHKVKLFVPGKGNVVLGHTRASTFGSPKFNENNHPFYGQAGQDSFFLAHNGILFAPEYLRLKYSLPKTAIETDSYVAVQLLNRYKQLDMQALKEMAQNVDGSFTFTILDNHNNLYFIKGDCPMSIVYFEEIGLYVYASTPTILCRALKKTGLDGITPAMIDLKSGDILRIGSDGETESGTFETFNYNSWFPLSALRSHYESNSSLHELIELGRIAGVKEDEIQQLFDAGYETTEIEELLEYPVLLHKQLDFIELGCDDDFEL